MNMQDIMHMNEVLKPYQERAKGENDDSFIQKNMSIEVIIHLFIIYK